MMSGPSPAPAHPPDAATVARAFAQQQRRHRPWAFSAAEPGAAAAAAMPHRVLAQRARQPGVQPGAPPCEAVVDPWRIQKFFVAGGLAGVISRTATAPIDRLKMLLQVEESVRPLTLREAWGRMQAEGSLRAFFRGNGTNALKIAPETAIKLALNDHLKHALGSSHRRKREEAEEAARAAAQGGGGGGSSTSGQAAAAAAAAQVGGRKAGPAGGAAAAPAAAAPAATTPAPPAPAPAPAPCAPCDPTLPPAGSVNSVDRDTAELSKATRVAIGGVSGAVGQGLVYPLDTVRTRLAVCTQQEYAGIARTAGRMWRTEGAASLYRGLVPSMCGIVPYAGVDIVLFETLKAELLERHGGSLPDLYLLAAGMASSVIAQFVSYPLALVRTRLQAQGSAGRPVKYRGMADVFARTLRHEGAAGLYKGLLPNLVKLAPAAGISWYVFESTKRLLGVDPRS